MLGITRQFLGVSAYMQQESLNALLREGNVVSGAYLAVEPGAEAAVYSRITRARGYWAWSRMLRRSKPLRDHRRVRALLQPGRDVARRVDRFRRRVQQR